MENYTYILVGGGMAAGSAISGIREIDTSGSILMISAENELPYNRPPLSKKLWFGGAENEIYLDINQNDIDFLLNTSVLSINPDLKRIAVSSGESFSYQKLLLATGGEVRRLPFGENRIQYLRTLADYHLLRELTEIQDHFAVIGAGFIGSEIAAALTKNGKNVTVLESGAGIGWKVFPEAMVQFLNSYYADHGVNVQKNIAITSVDDEKGQAVIRFKNGNSINIDSVIAGVGITPNESLAADCGLSVKDGIHVNEILQTSEPTIYAAGDIANFYNPSLERRIRVEHADNAKAMGKAAGRNMADANEPYSYLPLFYSDMFDLGYEAVGILDSRLNIVEDWDEKYKKGVLYYMEDEKVVGILLWNVWDKSEAAREVISSGQSYSAGDLKGLIK